MTTTWGGRGSAIRAPASLLLPGGLWIETLRQINMFVHWSHSVDAIRHGSDGRNLDAVKIETPILNVSVQRGHLRTLERESKHATNQRSYESTNEEPSAATWVEVGAGERMVDDAVVQIYQMLGRLSDGPQ